MRTHPVRVAIDIETTGLNPDLDAIIEIGALKFSGDTTLDTFESFVAAGQPVPYRIQRLTGIAPAQLREAPPMAELAPRLRAFLGDAPLVGHSVPFDVAFLRRHGLARTNPLVDTYELASLLLPSLASYTLGSVGAALGVRSPTYHRALADAQLGRDVFLALLERLDALDATTLDALLQLAMPVEWTPGYFLRAAQRTRRGDTPAGQQVVVRGSMGTLGAQLAAKLGVDPAVLSLAIAPGAAQARPRQRTVVGAQLPPPTLSAGLTQAASEAEASLRQTLRQHIGAALADGGPLLVELQHGEAGVLACAAEALRWAKTNDTRVLISLASSEAAGEFVQHVVPLALSAADLAPSDVRVAELGEQESYLCLHRWFGAARTPRNGALAPEVARGLARLTVWAGQTLTGARSEVALAGQELQAWARVRAGPDLADSITSCAYRRDGYCFVARAQQAAGEAHLIVTTHAALAAHLAGRDPLFPLASRALLFDAHLLEEELRRGLSCALERQELLEGLAALAELEPGGRRAGLLHLAAGALGQGGAAHEASWFSQVNRARQGAESFFRAARALLAEAQGELASEGAGEAPEHRAVRLDDAVRHIPAWAEMTRAWAALGQRLEAVAKTAREAAQLVLTARGPKTPIAADGVATDLYAAARALERARADGAAILLAPHDAGDVSWLRLPYPQAENAGPPFRAAQRGGNGRSGRAGARGKADSSSRLAKPQPMPAQAEPATVAAGDAAPEAPVFHRAPIRVGPLLAPLLADGHGAVFAAPALAVAGDFTYARGSLGLPGETQTLGSAMDRTAQTLLCLPTDVPEPNAPQYQRHLDDALIALALALRGRMVVLLPSHTALRACAAGIRRALERHDVLLLAQGLDGSARQLWHTFRSEPRVVLLGAGAFWEGADQSEQPPACVVVPRVPFPALSDPLLAARAETWADPQAQFVVPHAALRLRQALGGLAWSHWRRNAVVLFDRRLQTRDYGPTILGPLPRCEHYQETMAQIVERAAEWVVSEA